MKSRIEIPSIEIAAFCRRWQIVEVALFGSVLRDDFRPNSDVDVLVRFHPEARYTLLDMVPIQEELKQILGREVDLVDYADVKQSRNYIRRKAILDFAEVIYAT
ncbi:MAG: nucleotidyltransferase family protein [Planctomycetota bacterium]